MRATTSVTVRHNHVEVSIGMCGTNVVPSDNTNVAVEKSGLRASTAQDESIRWAARDCAQNHSAAARFAPVQWEKIEYLALMLELCDEFVLDHLDQKVAAAGSSGVVDEMLVVRR